MKMSPELDKIKKKYGERFAHFCRRNFSTILENEGKLLEILEKDFAATKNMYDNLMENEIDDQFVNYVYVKANVDEKTDDKEEITTENPKKLLDKAGYKLYHCKNESQVNKFKKFFEDEEKLCTFGSNRTETHHVFFAVKKDLSQIKRSENPTREDEYGTSVISIQFTKEEPNIISIKNRYNHSVANPDATFSNRLDNIIPGLKSSFEREYGLDICVSREDTPNEISGFVTAGDGKKYKYNNFKNGIYYCENNNMIKDGKVTHFDSERYILMDDLLVDLKENTIGKIDEKNTNSLVEDFNNIQKIDVSVQKDKDRKKVKYLTLKEDGKKDIIITLNSANNIIGYENENIKKLPDNYMMGNLHIENIKLANVEKIGNNCFASAKKVKEANFPKAQIVGNGFFLGTNEINNLYIPEAQSFGDNCFASEVSLENLNLPKTKKVGENFFQMNCNMKRINMPSIEYVGNGFLEWTDKLKYVNLPQNFEGKENIENKKILRKNSIRRGLEKCFKSKKNNSSNFREASTTIRNMVKEIEISKENSDKENDNIEM